MDLDDYFLYFDNENVNGRIRTKLCVDKEPKVLFVGLFPFSDEKVVIVEQLDGKIICISD